MLSDELSDDELRERLRAADPAARLTPLDPSQVTNLVETASILPARRPVAWLAGAAAAVVLLGGLAFVLRPGGGAGDAPVAGDGPSTPAEPVTSTLTVGPDTGRCVTPNPEWINTYVSLAFVGTVTAVDGDQVTIAPSTTFTGRPDATIRIAAPANPEAAVTFEPGGTYLVAASSGSIVGCGFSGPVTPELQALYSEAFAQ